jgi:hypothetical protein
MSEKLYEAWGPEASKKAFVHYPANTFPDQDKPLKDDTHHNAYGAYELARCVVQGIRAAKLPLANHLTDDAKSFDPSKPDAPDSVIIPPSPSPRLQPLPPKAADPNPPPRARARTVIMGSDGQTPL